MSNHDYEGEIEILPDGHSSSKFTVSFCINFDYTPPVAATWTDPGWGAEVLVNSLKVYCKGEKVDCPVWLERIVLDAIDDEVLVSFVGEDAW
jgi:hypothetical protein